MTKEDSSSWEFDVFRLDALELRLWRDSELLHVAPKALEILILLVRNQGETVSRDEIMDEVWGDSFVEDGNLNVHISNLRKILSGNSPDKKDFIETLPKHGYRFLVDVKLESDEKRSPAKSDSTETDETLQPSPARRIRWHFIGIVVLGMLFVSSFALWVSYWDNTGLSPVPVNNRIIRSVSVLPLASIDGDEDNKVLSVGLTDALISRLGKLNRFAVRPLSAVLPFPESGKDAIAFGRDLKVDAALVGTIQSDSERLRINVRLIDVRDGAIIWTRSFDETKTNFLKLQDTLSIRVANAIVTEVSPADTQLLTQSNTEDPEAYRQFLQGKFYLNKRNDEGIRKSIGYFEKAIELDPNFAESYVGLADANWLLSEGKRGYSSPKTVIQTVRKSILRALELDPNLAEAYTSLADVQMYYDWDKKSAEANFKKAIRINPNLDKAHHWYAWLLIADQRFDEANVELKLAHDLNPTSLIITAERGYPAFAAERYEDAIPHFEAALRLDPTFLDAQVGLYRTHLALGNQEEMETVLEEIKKLTSEDAVIYRYYLGRQLASLGKKVEARKVLKSLVSRKQKGEYVSPVYLAILALDTGDKDQAYSWLEKGFEERNDFMPFIKGSREFKIIQNEERFRELYDRMELDN
ncbi:MAG: tetratricopeptide repeat protein [Pyrinomonadaceae bacterium]|nr:tetratricopeptide repeat protein [Pyrinomonadaceae bacterium]